MADLAEKLIRSGLSITACLELSDTGECDVHEEQQNLSDSIGVLPITDGSAPLTSPKYERFLELYVESGKASVAYMNAMNGNCTPKSAAQQASRILRRADVARRLKWLMAQRKAAGAGGNGSSAGQGVRMTKADKLAELEKIIATGTPSDRVRAIQEHNRLSGDGKPKAAGTPDPAFLAEFMRRAKQAGRRPEDLANDPGEGDDEAQADEGMEEPPEPAEEPDLDGVEAFDTTTCCGRVGELTGFQASRMDDLQPVGVPLHDTTTGCEDWGRCRIIMMVSTRLLDAVMGRGSAQAGAVPRDLGAVLHAWIVRRIPLMRAPVRPMRAAGACDTLTRPRPTPPARWPWIKMPYEGAPYISILSDNRTARNSGACNGFRRVSTCVSRPVNRRDAPISALISALINRIASLYQSTCYAFSITVGAPMGAPIAAPMY